MGKAFQNEDDLPRFLEPYVSVNGAALAGHRQDRGMTQTALARAVTCTRKTIENYENEKSRASVPILMRIATALGVSAYNLCKDRSAFPPDPLPPDPADDEADVDIEEGNVAPDDVDDLSDVELVRRLLQKLKKELPASRTISIIAITIKSVIVTLRLHRDDLTFLLKIFLAQRIDSSITQISIHRYARIMHNSRWSNLNSEILPSSASTFIPFLPQMPFITDSRYGTTVKYDRASDTLILKRPEASQSGPGLPAQ